jgi:phage gp36-like protein
MSYCTSADLVARFSETEIAQLSDMEGRETINEAVVDIAINSASSEIDSYLAWRYVTPITDNAPDHLRSVCVDLAYYNLHNQRPSQTAIKRKEDALGWLKMVAGGSIKLPVASAYETALGSGGLAYSVPADESDNPTFTRLVW